MSCKLVDLPGFSQVLGQLGRGDHALPDEEDQDRRQDGQVREQRIDRAEDTVALALRDDVRTATNTSFINWNVLTSKCGAPAAISRSMIGANHGRAAASSTIATTQASSFSMALPVRSAMARARGTDGADHVANHFEVEVALTAEVVVEHRLVDAGAGGDAIGAGGVVAALGEFDGRGADRGSESRAAPFLRPRLPPAGHRSPLINQLVS